jgi:tetratricopeptide (TPR) repeat protein
MPLCIILAARRLTGHGERLDTLLQRATDDLVNMMEDASLKHLPERLRSLRASIDLSYNRLSNSAKALFARMSFFPGGLSRGLGNLSQLLGDGWANAAEEVAHYALARYERTTERYTMLHPVMEYARKKLDESEGDDFRRRAAKFWMEFAQWQDLIMDVRPAAQEKVVELLELPDEPEVRRLLREQLRSAAFAAMIMEEDNLVHSAEWTFGIKEDETGFQIVGALQDYLSLRAGWYTQEHLYRLALTRRRALAEVDPPKYMPDVATTLNNMGNLYVKMGHHDEALKSYKEALEIKRKLVHVGTNL